MIGSENENELALDNVAGIRERSQARVAGGGWRVAEEGNREYEHEHEQEYEYEQDSRWRRSLVALVGRRAGEGNREYEYQHEQEYEYEQDST